MPVSSSKEDALKEKMKSLGIRESDISEKFIRSSGKGGQHVNKVSTCVYLKHGPTGVEVKCGKNRAQSLNRFLARRTLTEKIEKQILGKVSEKVNKAEKIRRQKRKRSKRAKEKVLAAKKKQGAVKKLRKKVDPSE
ncbi:MAG: peptide chain release factor-like protein [Candidatus Omnitrophota bacterium]|nr:peptide chain release factor-like protein [Candidatus Omnitrophota bacterium]